MLTEDGSRRELYHIPRDRAEQNNLAAAHPEIVETLSEQVLAWKKTLPTEPAKNCISKFRK